MHLNVSFVSKSDRNEYLNIRDSYFPTLVYYSLLWGPFEEKKGVRENVASIFQNINYNVLLRTYGLVNLNLRTKEPEFQFSCVTKDCLAFPDKLWVSGPPLLNKGLHSLRLPEIYRTTIVPFSTNTPLVSIVWHDEQHSKLAEREIWLVPFDESEEKRSEVGENWR